MVSADRLLSFALATTVLLVLPGPAVMYIITRSATQGRVAGLVSVAGIHVGTLVHIGAAMAGLSAILATSATAFTVVKLLGAGYLMWLGLQSLLAYRRSASAPVGLAGETTPERSLRRVFADGAVLNILNPKTAIFFLSFVPQFVDPVAGTAVTNLAVLGAMFIGLGLVSDGAYALAGGLIGRKLRRSPRLARRTDAAAGVTYLGLGLFTALAANRTT